MRRFCCFLWLTLVLSAVTGACVKKVETLPAAAAKKRAQTASREDLVALINRRYGGVQSIQYGRMEVRVEGYYSEQEKKESYPKGSGYVVMKRPHWILMNVTNPLTHSTVASMAANGATFQLFVPGENKYVTGPVDVASEGENPFYHIRPQHVAQAVFIRPLEQLPARSFFVYEESDNLFSYYVIAELENVPSAPWMARRLWVERSALRLVRQQEYGENGALLSDAVYNSEARVNGIPVLLDVDLLRPADGYRLHFTFDVAASKINEPVEDSAFVVNRPPGAELVEVRAKAAP